MHTNIRSFAIALTSVLTACPCWVSFTDSYECPANGSTAASTEVTTAPGSETSATTASSGEVSPTTGPVPTTAPETSETGVEPTSDTLASTGSPAVCGDGVLDEGEECDHGQGNGDRNSCTSECKNGKCGDGHVGPGEACDDGNLDDDDACTAACEFPQCGDGVKEGDEQCDAGGGFTADCDPDCTLPECGDGYINLAAGETCDNEALIASGACAKPFCQENYCGDGNLYPQVEQCDLGAANDDNGACTTACKQPVCGDGFVWPVQEECDDGNWSNSDSCTSDCDVAKCGDGFVWVGQEECDDGDLAEGDGCSAECTEHKVVFATSKAFDGNLGGLTGADAKCQAAADAAALPGTFKAWLSDDTGDPLSRFTHASMPYVRRDGVVVAAEWSDLVDGDLSAAISLSEFQSTPGFDANECNGAKRVAFTNSASDGASIDNTADCAGWTSNAPASVAAAGDWAALGTPWTYHCHASCYWKKALYCVQQ